MLCDWCDIMGDNEESFVAENVADLVVGLFSIITCSVGLVLIMEEGWTHHGHVQIPPYP